MNKLQLVQGDCLQVMKDIPDNSIDLILVDLPYGTTDCAWDKVIPIDALWAEYSRIATKTGTIISFGSEPFSTKMRTAGMKHFKYDLIWLKNTTTGFQHSKNMPLKNFEVISVFSFGSMGHKSLLGDRRMTYNPQGLIAIEPKAKKASLRKFGGVYGARPSHKEVTIQEYTNYPKMVLEFENEKGLHQTQKPVPLLEYLIRTYTNEGAVVLDNCMGSGSTGVAAVNTGRDFIGIEIDPDFFSLAQYRIEEAQHATEKKEQ